MIGRKDDLIRPDKSTVALPSGATGQGRSTSGLPHNTRLSISFIGGLCADRTGVSISKDLITIGRFEECDIVLGGETISRVHCEISRAGSIYILRDASRNGTFVNGERVSQVRLQDGDQIRVGQNILMINIATSRKTRELSGKQTSAHRPSPNSELGPQIVVKGLEDGVTQPFSENLVTIGRGGDNHVVMDDDKVSRKHLEIERREKDYLISDLGSVNGTFLNDQRISKEILHDNDRLRIGDHLITVRLRDQDCILNFRTIR